MGMFSSGSDENVQMGGNDNTTQGKLKTTELYTWREDGFCGCHVLWKTGRPGALHPSSPVFQWPKATSVYKDSFSSFKLKGMVAVSPKGFPASWLWGSGLTAYVEAEHFDSTSAHCWHLHFSQWHEPMSATVSLSRPSNHHGARCQTFRKSSVIFKKLYIHTPIHIYIHSYIHSSTHTYNHKCTWSWAPASQKILNSFINNICNKTMHISLMVFWNTKFIEMEIMIFIRVH